MSLSVTRPSERCHRHNLFMSLITRVVRGFVGDICSLRLILQRLNLSSFPVFRDSLLLAREKWCCHSCDEQKAYL